MEKIDEIKVEFLQKPFLIPNSGPGRVAKLTDLILSRFAESSLISLSKTNLGRSVNASQYLKNRYSQNIPQSVGITLARAEGYCQADNLLKVCSSELPFMALQSPDGSPLGAVGKWLMIKDEKGTSKLVGYTYNRTLCIWNPCTGELVNHFSAPIFDDDNSLLEHKLYLYCVWKEGEPCILIEEWGRLSVWGLDGNLKISWEREVDNPNVGEGFSSRVVVFPCYNGTTEFYGSIGEQRAELQYDRYSLIHSTPFEERGASRLDGGWIGPYQSLKGGYQLVLVGVDSVFYRERRRGAEDEELPAYFEPGTLGLPRWGKWVRQHDGYDGFVIQTDRVTVVWSKVISDRNGYRSLSFTGGFWVNFSSSGCRVALPLDHGQFRVYSSNQVAGANEERCTRLPKGAWTYFDEFGEANSSLVRIKDSSYDLGSRTRGVYWVSEGEVVKKEFLVALHLHPTIGWGLLPLNSDPSLSRSIRSFRRRAMFSMALIVTGSIGVGIAVHRGLGYGRHHRLLEIRGDGLSEGAVLFATYIINTFAAVCTSSILIGLGYSMPSVQAGLRSFRDRPKVTVL